jgi:hypothetical protein
MNVITLIMPYYINQGMLVEHIRTWAKFSAEVRDHMRVIVVDDGSPKDPAMDALLECNAREINSVPLQVYRIGVDIRWNQDAARNIGARHAETSWLLLTDIDHMVPERTWKKLISAALDPNLTYQFARVSAPKMEPYKPHPNSWLMTKALYERIGGYDERFAGYYGTDGDFRDRQRRESGEPVRLKEPIIRVPRSHIPDASTTTYLRKQPEDKSIRSIKEARDAEKNYTTMRYRFPYERLFP